MGKSLVIKGADFSANGIPETLPSLDITSLLSAYFQPCKSLGSLQDNSGNENTKRCCIPSMYFSTIGVDISDYSQIVVTLKNGYDYVFGTGPVIGTSTNWQGWNGETGGQTFGWVTGNQQAVATVDATTLAISLNLRYDDNTTEFSNTTALTDIVDSIVLVP